MCPNATLATCLRFLCPILPQISSQRGSKRAVFQRFVGRIHSPKKRKAGHHRRSKTIRNLHLLLCPWRPAALYTGVECPKNCLRSDPLPGKTWLSPLKWGAMGVSHNDDFRKVTFVGEGALFWYGKRLDLKLKFPHGCFLRLL